VCQLIKAGGGEKKREFIHKSVAERGGIERHEAQQHTHTQKEAIHSNQIVRRCLLLLHPRPKQQQQQRNTRMKSEISPFFFVSKQKNVEIVSVIKSHPSNHFSFFSPFGQTFGSDLFSFNYFYFFVFFLFQAVKKVFVELIDSTERYWGVFNCNTFFFFLVGARLISMNKN
jgi:hypothetical protein